LIGRVSELERVAAVLRGGGRGVVLAGPAGVGTTRLANECMSAAELEGFVSVRVSATQGSASLPLGRSHRWCQRWRLVAWREEVLRQGAAAVIARGEGHPVAVFVDDTHLLDDASAALTHLLAGGARARVRTCDAAVR